MTHFFIETAVTYLQIPVLNISTATDKHRFQQRSYLKGHVLIHVHTLDEWRWREENDQQVLGVKV